MVEQPTRLPLKINTTYFTLKERHIYGSSRVGVRNSDLDVLPLPDKDFSMTTVHYSIGSRTYELSNHLGNVLSVISDKVIPVFPYSNVISEMRADIRVAQDYSPFGVTLDGRNFVVDEGYRYGFNGYEGDPEVKGNGNSYTTEFRQYDPRIGRWLSLDPELHNFAGESPYNFNFNNPLYFTDEDGDSPISLLIKWAAKKGIKAALKKYAKVQITKRLEKYMTKELKSQLVKDLDEVLKVLEDAWWETAIGFIPVAGDIYDAGKLGAATKKAWDKMQDLENKYVGKIYESLDEKTKKKFTKNMRRNGVKDAQKDQKAGQRDKSEYGNEKEYKGDGTVDGHHKIPVSERKDLMTDPRNIKLVDKFVHRRFHQLFRGRRAKF